MVAYPVDRIKNRPVIFRRLLAITGWMDAALALTFSIIGVQALRVWGPGISNAIDREEFGAWMLFGGLAIVAWLLAAAFAALACLCWRSHRRIGFIGRPHKADFAVLTIALIAAVVAISIYVDRFLLYPRIE